ncbi:hypothetical protein JW826_05235 [Candidatus Woesearchaeota archaeon]|nr:hypothetical protein [Candidatus Woesearchaeota archaeon]
MPKLDFGVFGTDANLSLVLRTYFLRGDSASLDAVARLPVDNPSLKTVFRRVLEENRYVQNGVDHSVPDGQIKPFMFRHLDRSGDQIKMHYLVSDKGVGYIREGNLWLAAFQLVPGRSPDAFGEYISIGRDFAAVVRRHSSWYKKDGLPVDWYAGLSFGSLAGRSPMRIPIGSRDFSRLF